MRCPTCNELLVDQPYGMKCVFCGYLKTRAKKRKTHLLDKKIKQLNRKLKIAVHMLNFYGNSDCWRYKDVTVPSSVGCHNNPVHTSFEVNPLQDGWLWAKEALDQMNSREPLTKGQRLTKVWL